LNSEYRDALLELASLYEQNKQPVEAIAIYQQFPDNAAARERAGELMLESGKPAESIPQLEAAVAKSPTAANRYALAIAYLKTKQPEKAITQLRQAVAVEPGNVALRMTLGRTLRDARNFPAAGEQFLLAAQQQPDSKEVWNELTGVLIMAENFPGALAALDKLKALGEETAAHHYFRAIILDRTKQYKPALESYNKFLAMSQNQHPDEEFKARQRIKVIQKELSRR
jgi:tetratricopeptide (TPR) repeat protein